MSFDLVLGAAGFAILSGVGASGNPGAVQPDSSEDI
jgi:hypothetical protein